MATVCEGCGSAGATLLCTGCRCVRYCSRDCRKRDWTRHRMFCGCQSCLKHFAAYETCACGSRVCETCMPGTTCVGRPATVTYETNTDCAVCLESLGLPDAAAAAVTVTLRCGHVYHTACVASLMDASVSEQRRENDRRAESGEILDFRAFPGKCAVCMVALQSSEAEHVDFNTVLVSDSSVVDVFKGSHISDKNHFFHMAQYVWLILSCVHKDDSTSRFDLWSQFCTVARYLRDRKVILDCLGSEVKNLTDLGTEDLEPHRLFVVTMDMFPCPEPWKTKVVRSFYHVWTLWTIRRSIERAFYANSQSTYKE